MNNNVKERLIAYIEYKGLSKHKFETTCGLSSRYISNISRSISPTVIEKISTNYPELNMGWVMTGEGEMLNARKPETPAATGIDIEKSMLNLWNELYELKERVRILEEGGAHTKKDLA